MRATVLYAAGDLVAAPSAWSDGTCVFCQAGGVEQDVTFEETADPETYDRIDAVCRAKYRRSGERMVGSSSSAPARAATIKRVPRSA